ncbi:hypothetical protein, conserved [Trypanosoma brucei gambiense DAL972]|uniref:Protein kinase domain-containing protein n=1 Tax=Trypanosoma brucei gambiense (strain MHOM/CI/86/DAL972) TaxID=679716 RepID=D0A8S0_TRYB9|nr:hypothetical protein, conserved [Trypanosoma brucei gambiense DAL972]CBH18071.1 hypothetical protein, conserved [Trypanosoma brucei gambiense DAL972]|eukprot:XP_011780335.1 hypothetical protein, conserved [Trypanosoma brucei gambiense DAL972]
MQYIIHDPHNCIEPQFHYKSILRRRDGTIPTDTLIARNIAANSVPSGIDGAVNLAQHSQRDGLPLVTNGHGGPASNRSASVKVKQRGEEGFHKVEMTKGRKFLTPRRDPPLSRVRHGLKLRAASTVFSSPLRKLRTATASLSEGESGFATAVDELTVKPVHVVRLRDVDGQVLDVQCDSVGDSPIASLIPGGGVNDGSCFTLHLLYDGVPPLTSSAATTPTRHLAGASAAFSRWYRYSTAATLYLALVDAGFCDRFVPLLSVQWIHWKELLQHQVHLRLDLMSNPPTRHMCFPCLGNGKNEKVPVAVSLPMTMKGKLRRIYNCGVPPSICSSPFTDAEVFQLFYIQLIFRAAYDVVFSDMMLGDDDDILRTDRIAVQTSGRQPLAFEHPVMVDKWLMFPPRSKILYITCFDHAVIPHFTSPARWRQVKKQRLFGASPRLQCQGTLGKHVVTEWAMHRNVDDPKDALAALEELFGLFESSFGVGRASVWQSAIPPRIYRCSVSAFERLWANNSDLGPLLVCASCPTESVSPNKSKPREEKEPGAEPPGVQEPGEEESVVQRWRQYLKCGDVTTFEGPVDSIKIVRYLGSGGSSLVYEGRYGPNSIPVAVKCFIIPCDMSHEDYVKESLTSVAFLLFFNQMEKYGIGKYIHMYDFVISSVPPSNMSIEDLKTCTRVSDPAGEWPKLCYLATTLMDGVIGRFLTEEDDDFDPCYDTLVNSPLCDGEIFQFLYMQLVLRALFDCTILDLMLNGQLRGDNLGFAHLLRTDTDGTLMQSFKGLFAIFQPDNDTKPQYLCFPASTNPGAGAKTSLRLINFIDFGQGKQPDLQELTRRGLIGETIVESCIQDDGFGRYWPLDRLYCQYVDTSGSVARQAVDWGAHVSVGTPEASEAAVKALFDIFVPAYGVDAPTEEELEGHIIFRWTPENVEKLRRSSSELVIPPME